MAHHLSYTDVKNAKLEPLRTAVEKWKQAPGKFDQILTNFNTDVTKGLADSNWQGESADAAWKKFLEIREEFTAAAEEARRVHKVMSEGLSKFSAAQKELESIVTELEGHSYLKVNKHDGSVYVDPPESEKGDTSSLTKAYRDTVADYRARTRKALEKASSGDNDLASALGTDVNGSDRGFNDRAYNSLEQAHKASAEDAKDAVALASLDREKMSPENLARLNTLMARHSGDPAFAETFATRLGPEKTLKLWYTATHPDPFRDIDDKKWFKAAKALQESLGTTLATASHSDSTAMQNWKSEMIRMGPERLDTGARTHPYGFQMMSNLMRFGRYDSGFLNNYGDKLIAWDKKHNTEEGMPYWTNSYSGESLNLHGKGDLGQDPMTGFLEGLGHNPGASTEFFGQPDGVRGVTDQDKELNPHFAYLTKDRNWDFDGMASNGITDPSGFTSLGHALTAATTGYAWDAEELGGKNPDIYTGDNRRTAETAGVMEQVVYRYTKDDGPQMLHDQPGMAESLGVMGRAYIDDINRDLGAYEEPGDAAKYFPPAYQGHAEFGEDRAIDFLSVLGHNKEAHALMNQGQHIYAESRLIADPPAKSAENWEIGRRALLTSAEARGILDESRVVAIQAEYGAESSAAQKQYAEMDDWRRVGSSAGAPALQNSLLNIAGKSGPWGAVIPVAVGGVNEMFKQFNGEYLFGGADLPEDPKTENIYTQGRKDSMGLASEYLAPHAQGRDAAGDLRDDVENEYDTGRGKASEGKKPSPG